ncbi:immunity-related GTPase family, e4 [Salvelinus alpinus]
MKNYDKFTQLENAAKVKEDLDLLENVTFNIAVTGESGSGKSTFVNALLGLDGDEGAAETGVMETTMKAIRCSHPTMPNVKIWDLPGIGTPNFKAKKYLKEVKFETYNFFIIIGTVRFKENNIMLAKEIQKMKMFYFVRSKIDNDSRAEAWKKNHREEDLLSKIRHNCEVNLKTVGSPKVFLISTFELGKSKMSDENLYEDLDIVKEIKNYDKFTPTENAAKAKEHLDLQENVTLNIAPNFKAKKYLKKDKFKTYNFFIIIGTVRFKENNIMLAKEIQNMKKIFYFVWSKIDNDSRAEAWKKNYREEDLLSKIRQNCEVNLKTVGNTNVFLISTFELGKYDFQKLIYSLEENLSEHKRSALIQALPVCSIVMIEKKRKCLFKSASTTAAVPIPGLRDWCYAGLLPQGLHNLWTG